MNSASLCHLGGVTDVRSISSLKSSRCGSLCGVSFRLSAMASTLNERTFACCTCSPLVVTTPRGSSGSVCQFSGPAASFRHEQSHRRSLRVRRSRHLSSASSFNGHSASKCKPFLQSAPVGKRIPSVGGVELYSSHESATTEQHSNGVGVKSEATVDKDFLPGTASTDEQLRPEFSFLNSDIPHLSIKDLETAAEIDAWELLRSSIVTFCGTPVGTIAAQDPTSAEAQNYDQVFIRDFIPSAIAFLLKGEYEIVRDFLLNTLRLQSWEKTVDCYNPGQGLMPASFKVKSIPIYGSNETEEILDPDFGEAAIGRVAPVDSGLWWIILLRAYGKHTGDYELQGRIEVQTGMDMILQLCLADGFDMFPTLLVTDGSCMIDRRMGIHGHPLEIQALFFSALRCAQEMINEETYPVLCRSINSRLSALVFHVREYYWLDMKKLNEIYRYQTEEYSHDAVNKFNIYPDQIPPWLLDWMPDKGGYLIGNLQPAHMDFRFFTLGNLWSVVSSLSDDHQSAAILELMDVKWKDFMGRMPIKITFPALEREEWRIITGADPKNTPWSYHNAGSWPVLLWQFTVACIKMGKLDMAQRAVEAAEQRLVKDRWPEYYDTRSGRLIGKQARLQQTWTIAGFLVSKMLIRDPAAASILTSENDFDFLAAGACGIFLPRRVRGKPKA